VRRCICVTAVCACAATMRAGLLQRREGRRSAFPAAKQQLRLLLQEGEQIDEANPKVGGWPVPTAAVIAAVSAPVPTAVAAVPDLPPGGGGGVMTRP
jgi:hypothetical protein